jgi:NADH-quinone oxidoreductase subunit C
MSNTTPSHGATAPSDAADAAAEAVEAPSTELHGFPLSNSCGQTVVHVTRAGYLGLIKQLSDDGYVQASDLCGVDYLTHPGRTLPAGVVPERFEVVVNLLDLDHRRRLRVRVQLPADDPSCPTLFDVHPGTEAMEREAYDMFGIVFTNHPDLTRILMPEDWDGHPLRKDYDVGAIPVQFSNDYAIADLPSVVPGVPS